MINFEVKTYPESEKLNKENQLAWKIAEIASDKSRPGGEQIEMVINRIIDNASVGLHLSVETCNGRRNGLAHKRKMEQLYLGLIKR